MNQKRPALFRGRHFEDVIIMLCVRDRISLSYRDLEEIMAERDLSVDHVTIWRWVQRYAPILNQRIRRELHRPNRCWRVDETYVRVAGSWAYLYRAVDSAGELGRRCRCGTSPYLNNIIEQDHRFIKKRIVASLGFRSAEGAWRTIEGYEAMHAIRKGQIPWLATGDALGPMSIHPCSLRHRCVTLA